MIRRLSCLIAALLCACSPSPEDTGPEALEAALSGTRTLETSTTAAQRCFS